MKQARLFTPGPTAVPAEVLETQARPLVHHRTEAFRDALTGVMRDLKYVMRTENPVVVLTASGTGAMEAAVVNLTRPGEKVIVTELGKFSERWREIAQAYGVEVVSAVAEWGTPVTAEQVEEAFRRNNDATVLFTTHSETSTGVLQDVAAFASIAHKHNALIAVDGITSVACHDVNTDEWGLDVVVGGSQKGVMVPPGLSFVSLSPAAIEKMQSRRGNVYYFDLLKALKSAEKADTPYTPAIALVFALGRALEMIRVEGIENVIARHTVNAGAVRAAVQAMGLTLLASVPCNATTSVVPPEGSASEIVRMMEHDHSVKIAGGQGPLKGRIVRLGHIGHYNVDDMNTMLTAFEAVCHKLGIVETTGPGVGALASFYRTARK